MSIMLRGNRHSSRFNVRRQVQLILRAVVHARADFMRDPIETGEDTRVGRLMRDREERSNFCRRRCIGAWASQRRGGRVIGGMGDETRRAGLDRPAMRRGQRRKVEGLCASRGKITTARQ